MKKQAGVALFVCLMILLILSLLGISAMRMMASQTMIAVSSQASDIAFQASETGINKVIADAKDDLNDHELLPLVPGVANQKTKVYDADDKGISSIKVVVSKIDTANDPDASARAMATMATLGAVGKSAVYDQYRFTSTGSVDAVGVSTTHVQEVMYPHL